MAELDAAQDAVDYHNNGVSKSANGDLNRTIADYDRAIELNPQFIKAFINRGLAKAAKRDLNGAIVRAFAEHRFSSL